MCTGNKSRHVLGQTDRDDVRYTHLLAFYVFEALICEKRRPNRGHEDKSLLISSVATDPKDDEKNGESRRENLK